jgi:hypothetical protein
VGPDQGFQISVSGKRLALKGKLDTTGKLIFGLQTTYKFDPDTAGDMFKLSGMLFDDTILEPLKPAALNLTANALVSQAVMKNFDGVKLSSGIILSSSAELLGVKIGAEVQLEASISTQEKGTKNIASIGGGFTGKAGLGSLIGSLDGTVKGKVEFSIKRDKFSSQIEEVSMTLNVSATDKGKLDFLNPYAPNNIEKISNIISDYQTDFLKKTSPSGEVLHGYKVKITLQDPKVLTDQAENILNQLLAGNAGNLDMVRKLVNLVESTKNSASIKISAIESDKNSIELEGKIIIGGGINGSTTFEREQEIFSWSGVPLALTA